MTVTAKQADPEHIPDIPVHIAAADSTIAAHKLQSHLSCSPSTLHSEPAECSMPCKDLQGGEATAGHQKCIVPFNRGDWQLLPGWFAALESSFAAAGFPLTVDTCARDDGTNALLPVYYSPHNSYLNSEPSSGSGLYCNPPFRQFPVFLRKFLQHTQDGCYGVVLSPRWINKPWYSTLAQHCTLAWTWDAGMQLFQAPDWQTDASTYREYGTTRWPVDVWIRMPSPADTNRVIQELQKAFLSINIAGSAEGKPADCTPGNRPPAQAACPTVQNHASKLLTTTVTCKANCRGTAMFDTGATRTFVASEFLRRAHLKPRPAPANTRVRLADNTVSVCTDIFDIPAHIGT